MIKLAEKYIHDNNYFPNHEEFNDYYLSHPDYPSLYAVTDTLTFFEIENIAARVPIDQFEHLPDKFLTLFNTGKTNEFIYITSKNDASVSYLTEENKETTITKNQFLSNWKEITVAVDENENPVDNRVAGQNKLQWSLVLFIGLGLIIFSSIFIGWLWDTLAYSVLSLIGLGLSILILQENFGLSNEITSKICGVTQTDKGACQSVLSSEGAKIYNSYTLSDACFILFGTLVVLNIFSSGNTLYFQIISIFFIPVILYSIWYQKIRIKKWCPLCLGISIVLTGIIIISLVNYDLSNIKEVFISVVHFMISFGLMAAVWMNLKPILNGYFELKKTDIIHKRFKRNTNVFKALSGTTQQFSLKTLQLLQKIELGNPEAKTELRLFLSPSCGHCHKAFEDSYNLFLTFSDKFKLSIYFNVNIENSQNSYSKICEIITQTYLLKGGEKAMELLKDWHINKLPLDSFEKKHIAEISEQAKAMILSHFNWCKENELNYTPVKIFQETLMPSEYSINDLKYFINELNEENLHHSIAD